MPLRPQRRRAGAPARGCAPGPGPSRTGQLVERALGHELPRLITTTSSTVCATSASTWLETRTVRPCRGAGCAGSRAASGCPAGRARWPARRGPARAGRPAARPPGSAAGACRASSPSRAGCRRPQLDQLEHLVDPVRGQAGRGGEARADGCARCGRGGTAAPRARRPRTCIGSRELGDTGGRRRWRSPAVGRVRPSSVRSVVVLPAPLGPRKPSTRPGVALKLRPSTATSPRSAWSGRGPRALRDASGAIGATHLSALTSPP